MGDAPALKLEQPPIPDRIGRYRIICTLGQGGMGTIYLGRVEGPGGFERLTAIKIIHEHLCREPAFVDMFLDEARLAARIRHPNVVGVLEVDVDRGRYFQAMDYVSGEPLSFVINKARKDPGGCAIDLMSYVVACACEGLHAAHELRDGQGQSLGVVHRDVSPHNIMIGYDGVVRVMDFGVAKAVDQVSRTQPGFQKGKIAYMAPEQIRSEPFDRRVDVFALGVVLWEATVGARLFRAPNDFQTAARVLSGKFLPPEKVRPGYPSPLAEIIGKALSLSPDSRYSTARELGHAVREVLATRGKLVAEADLESYMKRLLPERAAQRLDMERKAASTNPVREAVPEVAFLETSDGADSQETFIEYDEETVKKPTPVPPPEEKRARWPIAVACGGLAVLAFGLWFGLTRSVPAKAEEPAPTPAPVVVEQPAPAPAPVVDEEPAPPIIEEPPPPKPAVQKKALPAPAAKKKPLLVEPGDL